MHMRDTGEEGRYIQEGRHRQIQETDTGNMEQETWNRIQGKGGEVDEG